MKTPKPDTPEVHAAVELLISDLRIIGTISVAQTALIEGGIRLIVEAEREACAKVAEKCGDHIDGEYVAIMIRKRSAPPAGGQR